jgi:2-dehydropantoate 2-reductase
MSRRVTVVGAGAIGGTVGAYLARAGHDVLMVDADADHVAAMRRDGLEIQAFDETFRTQVEAATPDGLEGPLELVLLAVKSQHTGEAMARIAPLLTESGTVVSLQNGLCERAIAAAVGQERTVGALVNFSADWLEPGVIAYGGPGTLKLGELDGRRSDRLDRVSALLSAWGTVQTTDNVWGYLWAKQGYANMLFATALTDETMADVIDARRALMVELATEVYEVAAREGVTPEPFDDVEPALYHPREARRWDEIDASLDRLVARRRRDQKSRSGIWRDLAVRKRRTEVDQQIGLAAEIGAEHGLPLPLTRKLVAMIHELEDGTRERRLENLDELDALRLAEAPV